MQLRLATKLTCEAYINAHAWDQASLSYCLWHPRGGCGFRAHGHYERKAPAGLWIRRWYCPTAHQTASLLPDFAAAHLPGTLAQVEEPVAAFEQHRRQGCSVGEAAQLVRPDIELQGALRWVRRRRQWAQLAWALLIGCVPEVMAQVQLCIMQVQLAVGTTPALAAVREIAHAQLRCAPAPVGLAPRHRVGSQDGRPLQHGAGPDPPAVRV